MEMFKSKRENGKPQKRCKDCVFFAESDFYNDYLCKYHMCWLNNKDEVDDGWVCEHFMSSFKRKD